MRARFQVEIRGYKSHETDFQTLLDRRPDLQAPEITAIIDSAFEAFENTDGGKACAVVIVGYADREDSPGLADEQRRASELQASQARADSASAWLLDKVNSVAQTSGMQLEMEWKGVATVAVEAVGVGASDLVQQPATEQDRLNNRRIRFLISGNNVSAVTDRDGTDVLFAI
jgi:outer membrane protein OmpA-like peptidoglycan-associated protein